MSEKRTAAWDRAEMEDGTRLAYRVTGKAGGRRIVLIHALAMDGRFWDAIAERLAPEAQVLVYDCRGHGSSDAPAGPYDSRGFADDLARVLDAAGWDSAVIAGASMGGCIALSFAALHPERVDGLGLIDTTAWYGDDAPEKWRERGQKGLHEGLRSLVDFQRSRWFSPQFLAGNPDAVDGLIAVFLANDRKAYAASCDMLGTVDERAALAGFAFPCEIVVGENDGATPPEMAEALRAGIKDANLTVVPDARHFTPVEVPNIVAARLKALL